MPPTVISTTMCLRISTLHRTGIETFEYDLCLVGRMKALKIVANQRRLKDDDHERVWSDCTRSYERRVTYKGFSKRYVLGEGSGNAGGGQGNSDERHRWRRLTERRYEEEHGDGLDVSLDNVLRDPSSLDAQDGSDEEASFVSTQDGLPSIKATGQMKTQVGRRSQHNSTSSSHGLTHSPDFDNKENIPPEGYYAPVWPFDEPALRSQRPHDSERHTAPVQSHHPHLPQRHTGHVPPTQATYPTGNAPGARSNIPEQAYAQPKPSCGTNYAGGRNKTAPSQRYKRTVYTITTPPQSHPQHAGRQPGGPQNTASGPNHAPQNHTGHNQPYTNMPTDMPYWPPPPSYNTSRNVPDMSSHKSRPVHPQHVSLPHTPTHHDASSLTSTTSSTSSSTTKPPHTPIQTSNPIHIYITRRARAPDHPHPHPHTPQPQHPPNPLCSPFNPSPASDETGISRLSSVSSISSPCPVSRAPQTRVPQARGTGGGMGERLEQHGQDGMPKSAGRGGYNSPVDTLSTPSTSHSPTTPSVTSPKAEHTEDTPSPTPTTATTGSSTHDAQQGECGGKGYAYGTGGVRGGDWGDIGSWDGDEVGDEGCE
ncbi:hypothetical protein EJ05DRAFT_488168 [Pseudovirgaria hyperparasitica]|uniref:Uncharacterized protein n=1 Tax=Pseudovirgaria hyperparasitica TaxID=470096 RepID=A0A6A6W081_9PEZI|nr:uncharacterized protein EJ05DRAFT_488168 [Pseudovirgaria hyperparasitica]KAF2755394.1 hypothetical protein EJ05DRAFT_488168 [Pseudovirgaria hyperparasitica]